MGLDVGSTLVPLSSLHREAHVPWKRQERIAGAVDTVSWLYLESTRDVSSHRGLILSPDSTALTQPLAAKRRVGKHFSLGGSKKLRPKPKGPGTTDAMGERYAPPARCSSIQKIWINSDVDCNQRASGGASRKGSPEALRSQPGFVGHREIPRDRNLTDCSEVGR